MSPISYYDKNSKEFFDRTVNADVQDLYQKFLKHIPKGGRILDAGCGVGRDSRFDTGSPKKANPKIRDALLTRMSAQFENIK